MDQQNTPITRKDRIKDHFNRHAKIYIIGATCLSAGILIGYSIKKAPVIKQIIDNSIDRDGDNIIAEIFIDLRQRGHSGNVCHHMAKDIYAASQGEMAKLLNVSKETVRRMIRDGDIKILGEAANVLKGE